MKKLLYGYTNDFSLDLSKVIYFGQEDRKGETFFRQAEHLRGTDPNCQKFQRAKYILVAKVELGYSLTDLETYLIKKYRPELNSIHADDNWDYTEEEVDYLESIVKRLKWYLVKNKTWDKYRTLDNEIEKVNDDIVLMNNASHMFRNYEEFARTPFIDLVKYCSEGQVFIAPSVGSTTLSVPQEVIIESNSYLSRSVRIRGLRGKGRDAIIPYMDSVLLFKNEFFCAKVKFLWQLGERKSAAESFELDLGVLPEACLHMWLTQLYFWASELVKREPDFSETLTFRDLGEDWFDLVTDYEAGINTQSLDALLTLMVCYHHEDYEKIPFGRRAVNCSNGSVYTMLYNHFQQVMHEIEALTIAQFANSVYPEKYEKWTNDFFDSDSAYCYQNKDGTIMTNTSYGEEDLLSFASSVNETILDSKGILLIELNGLPYFFNRC